ncbi:MAG: hypothetical protein VYB34_07300 [Planctomycetota bacterium]|nr:hypothetical protein [Planctomycetota bacterium]
MKDLQAMVIERGEGRASCGPLSIPWGKAAGGSRVVDGDSV